MLDTPSTRPATTRPDTIQMTIRSPRVARGRDGASGAEALEENECSVSRRMTARYPGKMGARPYGVGDALQR